MATTPERPPDYPDEAHVDQRAERNEHFSAFVQSLNAVIDSGAYQHGFDQLDIEERLVVRALVARLAAYILDAPPIGGRVVEDFLWERFQGRPLDKALLEKLTVWPTQRRKLRSYLANIEEFGDDALAHLSFPSNLFNGLMRAGIPTVSGLRHAVDHNFLSTMRYVRGRVAQRVIRERLTACDTTRRSGTTGVPEPL